MVEHTELSERELQILRLVVTGAGNKEIANQLSISTNTVKVHLRNIFDKIQVSSRTEAAMYAVNHGLVSEQVGNVADTSFKPVPNNNSTQESFVEQDTVEGGAPPKQEIKMTRRQAIWGSIALFFILSVVIIAFFSSRVETLKPEETSFDSTRWEKFPELESGIEGLALAVQADQLFAIGGNTDSGVTDLVTAYNFENGNWEPKESKPTPVSDIQAVTIAGLIYVPGGIDPTGTVVNDLEIYNPVKNAWLTGTPLPEPRCRYSLVALEGMVFLFGGWDGYDYQNNTYMYDPTDNRWIELTPMLSPRAWTGGAISAGKVYIFGGINKDGISDQIDIFTPPNADEPSGSWIQTISLPQKRYAFGATALADLVFIVGGRGEDDAVLPDWIYYPGINEWRSFPSPIPAGAIKQGFTGAGTHLYIVGGETDRKILQTVYSYQAFFTASLPIVR
jgi:DNA-binding CsgD family transcriptional regulator/N-acetylneuraminic acid mutarotase